MAHYGQPIIDFEPEKDAFYEAITDYFDNPQMTKMSDREDRYSVYKTKLHCLLSNECRYLVAFVPLDGVPPGQVKDLKSLRWICFQTVTMSEPHKITPHGYQVKRQGPLKAKITRTENTPEFSTYTCEEFPITVTLLGEGKGGSLYQNQGNIILALETFSTVITFN